MRRTLSVVVVTVFVAAGTVAAKAAAVCAERPNHLEPEGGLEDAASLAYRLKISQTLLPRRADLVALVRPSFQPEWALALEAGFEGAPGKIRYARPRENIWHVWSRVLMASTRTGAHSFDPAFLAPLSFETERRELTIDAKAYRQLDKIWRAMLATTSVPRIAKCISLDGITYFFGSLRVMGQTHSPPGGSLPAAFAELAELIASATEPVGRAEARKRMARLLAAAAALEKRLEKPEPPVWRATP